MEKNQQKVLGFEPNVAAMICYVFGFVTGLVFFFGEKENKFVRFHAMQSIMTFGGIFAIRLVLAYVPMPWAFRGLLGGIIGLVTLVAWIAGIMKAKNGEMFKFPIVGDLAEQQI